MAKQTYLPDKVKTQLVNSIKVEGDAHQLYKQFTIHSNNMGFLGAQAWFKRQSMQELEHQYKVIEYMTDRGCCFDIPSSTPTAIKIKDLYDLLQRTLTAEINVENNYKELYKISSTENDPTTCDFAYQMLREQVEEIAVISDIIAKYDSLSSTPAIAIHDIDSLMKG